MASWWNPFSWFKKSNKTNSPTIEIKQQQSDLDVILTDDKKNEPIIKTPILDKLTSKVIQSKNNIAKEPNLLNQVVSTRNIDKPIIPNSNIEKIIIFDISTTVTSNSAQITWKTNKNSESKVLINGKQYISSNIDTLHNVQINDLDVDKVYRGSITAITNGLWSSENITFKTKQRPLEIENNIRPCSNNVCTLSWSTNYLTNSRVVIKNNQTSEIFSLDSQKGTSDEHYVNIHLDIGSYLITIYATNDVGESIQLETSFNVLTPCVGRFCANIMSA